MKAIIFFFLFISSAYGADLKELAETIFDVDYIDFDQVYIIGTPKTGQVLVAVCGNRVFTKTLIGAEKIYKKHSGSTRTYLDMRRELKELINVLRDTEYMEIVEAFEEKWFR